MWLTKDISSKLNWGSSGEPQKQLPKSETNKSTHEASETKQEEKREEKKERHSTGNSEDI